MRSYTLPKTGKCHISVSMFELYRTCLFVLFFSGSNHTGFPHFACPGREGGSVSSSAFVLLPPPGSHPAAGGPRLVDHLEVGNELDADVFVLAHADDCSGDSKRAISQILPQTNLRMLNSLLFLLLLLLPLL